MDKEKAEECIRKLNTEVLHDLYEIQQELEHMKKRLSKCFKTIDEIKKELDNEKNKMTYYEAVVKYFPNDKKE